MYRQRAYRQAATGVNLAGKVPRLKRNFERMPSQWNDVCGSKPININDMYSFAIVSIKVGKFGQLCLTGFGPSAAGRHSDIGNSANVRGLSDRESEFGMWHTGKI